MKIISSTLKYGLTFVLSLSLSCTRPDASKLKHDQVPEDEVSAVMNMEDYVENAEKIEEIPFIVEKHAVKHQSTLYSELRQLSLSSQEILDLIEKSRPFASLDRVAVNFTFLSKWQENKDPFEVKEGAVDKTLKELEFILSETQSLHAKKIADGWSLEMEDHPIQKELRSYYGAVTSSLWESATQSGMEPSLIIQLTEIFAWQVDFNREVQPGDHWRLVVEEHFARDKSIGWGEILAAEYVKQGETFTAIKYPQEGTGGSYYSADGQSLRLMFLKSPIKFGRISSRFSHKRFHPILKQNRPHLGVDYAAPIGTPIRSVGKGKVTYVGYNGGSGKMVKIRHNSVYETAYLHLNGYAKGLRRGATVEQGELIGYVGRTGLATGPHLHFSFYENGRYVDPLGKKFPAADPVPKEQMESFGSAVATVMPLLPDWRLAMQEEKASAGH
ncbi:MAG: M23 family metallopeptidase [Oligoflexus sp.]